LSEAKGELQGQIGEWQKACKDVERFFGSLRSAKTQRIYIMGVRLVLGTIYAQDPKENKFESAKRMAAQFLIKARQDPGLANADIIDWINEKKKEGMSVYQLKVCTASVRSLLKFCGVMINDYQIGKALPRTPKPTKEHPTLADLRALRRVLDLRGRFILSAMVSGFFRNGAWDYLRMKDLKEIEVTYEGRRYKIGKLTIYAGEPERYTTFISSEALEDFHHYLEMRQRAGEEITPDSPLVRANFNEDGSLVKNSKLATSVAIQRYFARKWKEAGFREKAFKTTHGFRSYAETTMQRQAKDVFFVKKLMGHTLNVDDAYYNPSEEEFALDYAKNMHVLFISESAEARKEAEAANQEKDRIVRDYKLELAIERDRRRELEERISKIEQQVRLLQQSKEKVEIAKKEAEALLESTSSN
jgi:hypothetical protein